MSNNLVPKSPVTVDELAKMSGLRGNELLNLIYSAAMDGDPDAMKIINCAKQNEHTTLSLGELCAMSGVKPTTAMGLVVNVVSQFQRNAAIIKGALALPDAVDATIASAKQLGQAGLEDRKMLYRQHKLPVDAAPSETKVIVDQRQQTLVGNLSEFERLIKGGNQNQTLLASGDIVDAEEIKED